MRQIRGPLLDASRQQFHARWASIAASTTRPPGDDPRPQESLRFHAAATGASTRRGARIAGWLHSIVQVEDFISAIRDVPRSSSRARAHPRTADEPHLARWLRAQRVHETHGRLCSYQQERITNLPGFEWEPLLASWDDHAEELTVFLTRASKTPSRHAADSVERALAVWHRNQKTLLREGRLTSFKIHDMRRLEALAEHVRAGQRM